MKGWVKKKEVERLFSNQNIIGTQVWILNRVKEIPPEIINITRQLSELDFIKYIRLTDDSITASSEIEGTRIKTPVTKTHHETAVGVKLIFHNDYKIMDFDEINSPIKGHGSKMVDAILTNFPLDWQASVFMDYSNGFWDKMNEKYEFLIIN